ncbi:MAG: Gfo/Idh/MocA family oxidoreductase [Clostridia bacterium]|nr:Gfo/Idh/MocA family oxidoreductase [Clostridia bacterium]
MRDIVRIGYIGCGRRGIGVLKGALVKDMPDTVIAALCDLHADRMEKAAAILEENGRPRPMMTTDYREILADPTIDAVIIMTDWLSHMQLIEDCLVAGKPTGVEVGCTYDIADCFHLIDVYERTGTPLMMLENCCYTRREMVALHMERRGLLGEVVHCDGGYQHNLMDCELFLDIDNPVRHYRIENYTTHNCDQYPTHALGPIAKLLRINRGNRMVRLSSFASKSRALAEYTAERFPADSEFNQVEYIQGDIITTVITCAGGETIRLTLDTTLPRSHYSRDFTVRGTKGMLSEEHKVVYLKGMPDKTGDNEAEMFDKYDHPLYKKHAHLADMPGHSGADWLVCRAFIESVKAGTNTPIDAYDTITWMAVAALSEQSVRRNGAPVDFPDFTRGKWQNREPIVESIYCLDEIIE